MATGLSAIYERSLQTGYTKGLSLKWQPKLYNLLARRIPVTKRDNVQVYGMGDLCLPDINPASVLFEDPAAYSMIIAALDHYDKGYKFDSEQASRLPEVIQYGAALPRLFGRKLDNQMAAMLVAGDATTYTLTDQDVMWGGAGVTFFSASHAYSGGMKHTGTMKNLIAHSDSGGLDVADPDLPTVAEWKTAIAKVWQYICENIVDTSGEYLFEGGERLDLLIPPAMEFAARGAFEVTTVTEGGENVYRTALHGGDIIPDIRLSDSEVFYLLVSPGGAERPLWHADGTIKGKNLELASTTERSHKYVTEPPGKIWTRASKYQKLVYGDWRMIYRCVFE